MILGVEPFAGLSPWVVAGVLACHFGGFFIRGAFGFGSNMPIVLLTAWLLGPHHAIVLVVLAATAAQVHLFPQGVKGADWSLVGALIAGVTAGVGFGTWVFDSLPADWLTLILGALVGTIVLMDRLRVVERLSRHVNLRSPAAYVPLSLVSGTVGTVSGGGGIYFLVGFLKFMCPTPGLFRSTNLVLSGLFMAARIFFIALAGYITATAVVEAALLLPVVFLGTWAGSAFFRGASTERFYALLQAVLLLAAAMLVVKGLLEIA